MYYLYPKNWLLFQRFNTHTSVIIREIVRTECLVGWLIGGIQIFSWLVVHTECLVVPWIFRAALWVKHQPSKLHEDFCLPKLSLPWVLLVFILRVHVQYIQTYIVHTFMWLLGWHVRCSWPLIDESFGMSGSEKHLASTLMPNTGVGTASLWMCKFFSRMCMYTYIVTYAQSPDPKELSKAPWLYAFKSGISLTCCWTLRCIHVHMHMHMHIHTYIHIHAHIHVHFTSSKFDYLKKLQACI